MVKVLTVDLFQSGGLLPIDAEPGSEPIAVATTQNFVLVASANGLITFYNAVTGIATSSFRSRAPVTGLWYSEVTGALFTVEAISSDDCDEEDYVFPRNDDGMLEWRVRTGPSPSSPVVTKLMVGERFVVNHREGQWARVRLRRGDGYIVGWTRTVSDSVRPNTTYLHRATEQRTRTMPRLYYNWDRGTVATPATAQVVRQVEVIGLTDTGKTRYSTVFEGNLDQEACVSVLLMQHYDTAVQCISVCPSTGNVAVCSREQICVHQVELVNNFPVVTLLFSLMPKCEIFNVALCQEFVGYVSTEEVYVLRIGLTVNESNRVVGSTTTPSSSSSSPSHLQAQSQIDDSVDWNDDANMVSLEFGPTGEASSTSANHNLQIAFKTLAETSEQSFKQDEIRGPVAVADQGVKGAPECGYWVSSCDCYLYKSFNTQKIHTLKLIAAHAARLSDLCEGTRKSNMTSASPLLPSGAVSGAVCCFVSHELQGFMYGFIRGTRLLSTYSYMQPSNSASISDYLLFITTAGDIGHVESYTIRNVLDIDQNDGPIESMDVTFFGKKNIFSPDTVEVGDRNVVILVKHSERKSTTGTNSESFRHGTDTHAHSYNVYYLRTCGLSELFDMILGVGKEHEQNWPYYYQVLLEGHQLLRAQVSALVTTRFSKSEAMVTEKKAQHAKYVQLLRNSCALLGDHLLCKREPEWKSLALFYTESRIPLKDLFDRLTSRRPGLRNISDRTPLIDADLLAATCIVKVMDEYLFRASHRACINDTQSLANNILSLYWHVAYHELPRVVLHSNLTKYSAEYAATLLKSPPKHVSESDDDNTDYRDELAGALCLLCLRLGDKKGAKKQIVGRADFLRRLCIQTPSLLYKELLADDGSTFDIPKDWKGTTLFCALINEVDRELLINVFEGLHGKVSIRTALACLSYSEAPHDLSTSLKYLEATVERNAVDRLDDKSMFCCVAMLLKYHFDKMHSLYGITRETQPTQSTKEEQTKIFAQGWLRLVVHQECGHFDVDSLKQMAKVHAVIRKHVSVQNAEKIHAIIKKCTEETPYAGSVCLTLLCLPSMTRFKDGQMILLQHYPEALIDYCKCYTKTASRDVQDWDWIHKALLDKLNAQPDVNWQPYYDLLEYVAEALDPKTFLQILPDNGRISELMKYVEHSYRHSQARALTEVISEKSVVLL
eukprot:m.166479 g.166479  ORF g.166479 m.166479 type:complete len:1175 (-) comp31429_c1_seq3:221-3745(-)